MIRAITPNVAGYPAALAALRRPPPELWLRGSDPPAECVAVVGTRRPDGAGRALARAIGAAVARRGLGVVSGLAPGIDCAAHRGALGGGGATWAVVGCGVDLAAAPGDPRLVEEMLAGGGGVVAEVPPGTASSARTLVARDRIQSGLSGATVVVQTDLASGTMHTARFTVEQGRLLAVVAPPGSGRSDVWAGNAALTAPAGCDPGVLHAKGKVAALVAARRPVADLVLAADGDLAPLWEALGV
ncbi:MAG TPA: DNA-processing protein DprA [Acidimicrobiales bacterium]|nr:DNA-processing protein DprA [Acidimicrobiales bacterium]